MCTVVRCCNLMLIPQPGIDWLIMKPLDMYPQAKLAQEAMQALELGADNEPSLTGRSAPELIIPKGL